MPNGRTHDIITAVVTPIIIGGSYLITKDIKTIMLISTSFLFASLMFNGDLDINSRPYNRWFVFKMIWIPYQLMFKHRSIWTHGLVIGTIVRILYLGIIPFIYLLSHGKLNLISLIDLEISLLLLVGLELGSAVHTISDKIF